MNEIPSRFGTAARTFFPFLWSPSRGVEISSSDEVSLELVGLNYAMSIREGLII
jgi:hypothetical protein